MPFTEPALTEKYAVIKGRTWYRLEADLVYTVQFNGGGITVVVPKDFVTDKASTPRFLRPWFPPDGLWSDAAILHDYLYTLKRCRRFLADALFRHAMAEVKVGRVRRYLMYLAVRLFGHSHKQRPQPSTPRGFP